MLFGGNLPVDEKIGDSPGVEIVPNPTSCPSFSCVGEAYPSHQPSCGHGYQELYWKRISKCPLEELALLNEDLSIAAIYLSIAQVWFSQQAALEDYQATGTSLASIQACLETLEATLSQHQEEILRLEQEKGVAMEVPTLSPTDVETKTLEGLLEGRRRSFKDIAFK
ncbi:hypothetical protein DVH24_034094 [Malus domestica]|uniref:BRO1 domain-containing protein n=1 Tax=Malus domestica TaxID=3750 RepID=A0A498KPG1_MALDO|nr:hypothetical protein DVH24_034094 [Malus domestica]